MESTDNKMKLVNDNPYAKKENLVKTAGYKCIIFKLKVSPL